ncbi:MAG: hypothetical protein RSA40_01955 [Malacoplasma sp.]
MNNELACTHLNRIKKLSISLFFVEILGIFISIMFPMILTIWVAKANPIDPNNPIDPTTGSFDWAWISTIVFSIFVVLTSTISLALAIAILVFACVVKVNNESIPILIIFAALGFILFIISPLVLWILSVKYKKIAEDEMIKEHKNSKTETVEI